MKFQFLFSLSTIFLFACGGNSENATNTSDSSEVVVDTIAIFQGVADGYDDALYIFSEDELILTEEIKEIHIVPAIEDGTDLDSSSVVEIMLGIIQYDFCLYFEDFKDFDGKIKIYYDAQQKHLCSEFNVIHQMAEGVVKVYSPENELMIHRVYENGNCVESIKDIYAIDWTFIPTSAILDIENLGDYQFFENDGTRIVKIGGSMNSSAGEYVNELYAILEKPVFDNIFTVNGVPFTGKLQGFHAPNTTYEEMYFELQFIDGKLHGNIQIYNEMGDLELEEEFSNGLLIKTIFQSDYSDMGDMAKPVIYLYPEKEMNINVQLNLRGKMTHSYPKYSEGGWNVKAQPNGTIYDENGKEFYALFWEGESDQNFTYSEGFVVKGNETELFLENSLAILGLTRREANEFIMFWLPQMENNAYNLIHFSTTEYEEMAALKITPQPETIIRVMMVWSPLEKAIEIPQQNLYDLKVERKGFTVVEWGGKQQEFLKEL